MSFWKANLKAHCRSSTPAPKVNRESFVFAAASLICRMNTVWARERRARRGRGATETNHARDVSKRARQISRANNDEGTKKTKS